ncbi:MAG: preprotein translocase subunit Sec61beta [Candidatus Micrarchaeota archaeon]|nr:preprotein translocase subunit Sec61beta [Candidatus Micrarchaeota archaeon]
MAKDTISTPQSQTGLMRFYDVSSSNIQIDPKVVMAACAAVIVLEIVFHVL